MSMTFFVKNKKKLFGGYAQPMSVEEILNIAPNVYQYSFNEATQDFNKEQFYNSQISEYECLLLGVDGLSGRGFEVGFSKEDQSYNVRIYTPSTKNDWEIALEYIKNLSLKLGSNIVSEYGDEFSNKEIENFEYEEDILAGLNSLKEHLSKDDIATNITYGINYPVAFNEKMVDEILNSSSPIEEFSKFVTDIQNLDAYFAKQTFYKNKDGEEIFGVYALTQGVDTILPFKPNVEYEHLDIVKNTDVAYWEISLIGIDGNSNDMKSYNVIDKFDYDKFISNLPKDKYKFIDASYILVNGFKRAEFDELISKIKEQEK